MPTCSPQPTTTPGACKLDLLTPTCSPQLTTAPGACKLDLPILITPCTVIERVENNNNDVGHSIVTADYDSDGGNLLEDSNIIIPVHDNDNMINTSGEVVMTQITPSMVSIHPLVRPVSVVTPSNVDTQNTTASSAVDMFTDGEMNMVRSTNDSNDASDNNKNVVECLDRETDGDDILSSVSLRFKECFSDNESSEYSDTSSDDDTSGFSNVDVNYDLGLLQLDAYISTSRNPLDLEEETEEDTKDDDYIEDDDDSITVNENEEFDKSHHKDDDFDDESNNAMGSDTTNTSNVYCTWVEELGLQKMHRKNYCSIEERSRSYTQALMNDGQLYDGDPGCVMVHHSCNVKNDRLVKYIGDGCCILDDEFRHFSIQNNIIMSKKFC